jgi:hypothetical protein
MNPGNFNAVFPNLQRILAFVALFLARWIESGHFHACYFREAMNPGIFSPALSGLQGNPSPKSFPQERGSFPSTLKVRV